MNGLQEGCSCGGALTVLDRGHVAVRTDLSLYSTEAVFRAAYKMTDRCHILLERQGDHVTAFLFGKTPDADVTDFVGLYANELIDQQLRENLERQFQPIRTLITAQAFAEGNLLDPEREDADYNEDPRGIGTTR